MKAKSLGSFVAALAIATLGFTCAFGAPPQPPAPNPTPPPGSICPTAGWQEGLAQYLAPDAPFPSQDTKNPKTPDCIFHQWSWEAFVWATALVPDPNPGAPPGSTLPRFMTLNSPDGLLPSSADASQPRPFRLMLGGRSRKPLGNTGYTEGAGAIVEADGNMLVSQNGYPVYASVHMTKSYYDTAKQNMIANGGYQKLPRGPYFPVGAAVFKATWLRLNPGEQPPAGAYTTQAQVPVLATTTTGGIVTIAPVIPAQFVTVTVALVGLHVVGHTVNHPEFLWGTFEHNTNSPETPDNTFTTSGTDPNNYTFYKANTPFSAVNQAIDPPALTLNETSQTLSPVTNVVLENRTGGDPAGPTTIVPINGQGQRFLAGLKSPQSTFATYHLIGTVWMAANSYNLKSNQTNALGSVTLANSTAETFVQSAKNTPISGVLNCFLCHNASSYSFQTPPPKKLVNRLIALSHVLGYGSEYEVPNKISTPPPQPAAKAERFRRQLFDVKQ